MCILTEIELKVKILEKSKEQKYKEEAETTSGSLREPGKAQEAGQVPDHLELEPVETVEVQDHQVPDKGGGEEEGDCCGLLGRQGSTPQGAGALSPQEPAQKPDTSNPPEENPQPEPKQNLLGEMRKIREAWKDKNNTEEAKKKKDGKKTADRKNRKEEPKKMNLILEMWKKRDMEEARKETRTQESSQVNTKKNNPPGLYRGRKEVEDQKLRKEAPEEKRAEVGKKVDMEGIQARKEEVAAKPPESGSNRKVDFNLNAGNVGNLEGNSPWQSGSKEGSLLRKKEAETGAIPKVRIDLDSEIEEEKEEKKERKGLEGWKKLGLGRKRKAEEEAEMVLKQDKPSSRKPRKTKEALDLLKKKKNSEKKVSPLITRFNFSSTSEVGHGEGGDGVRDCTQHDSQSDARVMGEHPRSTESTGPNIGRVGQRSISDKLKIFEGQGDNCLPVNNSGSKATSTGSERAQQGWQSQQQR